MQLRSPSPWRGNYWRRQTEHPGSQISKDFHTIQTLLISTWVWTGLKFACNSCTKLNRQSLGSFWKIEFAFTLIYEPSYMNHHLNISWIQLGSWANLESSCSNWFIPDKINLQSLEDMQSGYILQKYTLDKYTLEKYTLDKYTLDKYTSER